MTGGIVPISPLAVLTLAEASPWSASILAVGFGSVAVWMVVLIAVDLRRDRLSRRL